jgi:hypothetical protein
LPRITSFPFSLSPLYKFSGVRLLTRCRMLYSHVDHIKVACLFCHDHMQQIITDLNVTKFAGFGSSCSGWLGHTQSWSLDYASCSWPVSSISSSYSN